MTRSESNITCDAHSSSRSSGSASSGSEAGVGHVQQRDWLQDVHGVHKCTHKPQQI